MKTNTLLHALSLSSLLAVGCGPSLGSMHARAAVGEVQPDAPLHTVQAVTIAAPRDRVWALFTDFGAWPSWQPNITRVSPPSSLEPGSHFTWVNGTSEISSTLAVVRPSELLGWTGSVATAKAIHLWRFSSPTPETTRVEVDETMDGFLLTWFYGQKDLEAEIARSLGNLRKASESATVGQHAHRERTVAQD